MKDFCIEATEATGNLALIGEILGAAGVNIGGLSLTSFEERQIIHFIVEDAETASRVLENASIQVKEISEVYILDKDKKGVTGRPGSFGGICRLLADHGITVRFAYPAENNRFVFGVDQVDRVRELLG